MRQLYQRLWRMVQRLCYENANVVLLVGLSISVASILRHFNQRYLVLLLNKRIIACQAGLFRLQHN